MNPVNPQFAAGKPVTRGQWTALLTRVISPATGSNVRRQTRRYPMSGEVRIVYTRGDRAIRRSADTLAVSRVGLTVRGHCEVEADAALDMEVNLDGNPIPARGRVVH